MLFLKPFRHSGGSGRCSSQTYKTVQIATLHGVSAGFPNTVRDANQLTGDQMAVQMTKSQLIEKIAGETEVAKKDVKGVLETLATVGYKELKKSGVFLVPGFAKFVVVKKPATKARQGTNPFTGEAMTFKAKPARKIVRARPVKAAKDAV
jgi:DNA-binding protein HU-beta